VKNCPLPRLDRNPEIRERLMRYSRIREGEIWDDPAGRHRVGCLDAAQTADVSRLMLGEKAALAIQDPPYNQVAFEERNVAHFIDWCRHWIAVTDEALAENASLYVWMGADQKQDFQPLPDFMLMMRETGFRARSLITVRNQRGYGTLRNWMAVRQELLFYVKGSPDFDVSAEYTDAPKKVGGYYKSVNGKRSENLGRGRSTGLRAGNVWVDVQQVFYRLEENVNGCYAQKPLKSCERIIRAATKPGDLVIDFFGHSGTTLMAAERLGRRCRTIDVDPVFSEIAIRRLERYRETGRTGWQNSHPFECEIESDSELRSLIRRGGANARQGICDAQVGRSRSTGKSDSTRSRDDRLSGD
jgi:site-specific DNA-methyltransferase (adenine-specific)